MFLDVLQNLDIAPILGFDLHHRNAVPIDLSIYNKKLHTVNVSDLTTFGAYIQEYLAYNHVKVALGGYLEERDLYSHHALFDVNTEEKRCIHLGIDIWAAAQTPIYAPLEGIVHSFAYNEGVGNYGGTVILEHLIKDTIFYTLYGHLSVNTLKNLYEGKKIVQGMPFATLGFPKENGHWVPHLHFQIIMDIAQNKGDYIGVCTKQQRTFYAGNCPNPKFLLSKCSQLLHTL